MKEQIKWIKPALATKDVVAAMTYYLVRGGYIHAHNGRMTAATPFNEEESFLVSGAEVEEALNRLPGEPVLVVGDEDITLKSGRFRSKIKTLNPDLWSFPLPEHQWQDMPVDLPIIMKQLRPFISDNATKMWALCLCLRGGMAYATNNICVGRKACSVAYNQDILIPCWAIDFVLDKDKPPVQWMALPHYIAFRWEDGSFMRSALVTDPFPEQVAQVIEQAKQAAQGSAEGLPACDITHEWRQAFETVASSSDGSLLISPTKIVATRSKMDMEAEVASPVAEDTFWDPKFVGAALRCADRFYPSLWPRPCYFEGDGIDGVVMGRAQ